MADRPQAAANPLVLELDKQVSEMETRAGRLQKSVDVGEEYAEMMRTSGFQRIAREHKNAVRAFQKAAIVIDFDDPEHRKAQARLKERTLFFSDCRIMAARGHKAARDLETLQGHIDKARQFARRQHG